ncbi:HNH endonuclease [Carnobacterium sp.]|uniref:HNH endonuclease n=1 Tax=Carnobacterium sp. TaxID=48221 RepID=UPI00388E2EE5
MLNDLIEKAKLRTNNDVYADRLARNNFYQSQTWRNKRKAILKRDNNECQVAKSTGGVDKDKLIVHHVKPLEYFPELAMDDSNLITVSHRVHNIIHGLKVAKFNDEWW